jgi:alpha-glucosidase
VREEFDEILRFWLRRGIDGFRIDVAHALVKHPDLPDIPESTRPADPHDIGDAVSRSDWERYDHPYDIDQEGVTEIYRRWRRVVEPFEGLLLGEVYIQDPAKLSRYLNPQDGLHLSFWFKPLHIRWSPEAIREVLRSALAEVPEHLAWVQGSHDRSRSVTRFGGGDLGRARSLALGTLYMGLPGVPFLYMGEELGLDDVPVPPERSRDPIAVRHEAPERARDNCRTPMPWEPAPGYGFTRPDVEPWLPFGDRRPHDTAAVQRDDPASWLSRWRRLIAVRRSCDLTAREIDWAGRQGDVVAYRRGVTVFAANCGEAAAALELPRGRWTVLFDSAAAVAPGGSDGAAGEASAEVEGRMRLAAAQAVVLRPA